jgi:hypothetical protein
MLLLSIENAESVREFVFSGVGYGCGTGWLAFKMIMIPHYLSATVNFSNFLGHLGHLEFILL